MILTDTDIIEFSNKLGNKFFIKPEYTNFSSWPVIGFYLSPINPNNYINSNSYINSYKEPIDISERIKEPEISYEFTFSVCEKRIEEFNDIFKSIFSKGFENFVYNSKHEYSKIELSEDIVLSKKETLHTFGNRKYIKLQYIFGGKTSSIIAYIQTLKDSIEFFSMIWGYTKKGEELYLLKYTIGSIVSPIEDRSKDILIFDYNYTKNSNKYEILYEAYEILSDENSSILRYADKPLILKEDKITLSRNTQVNSILN